MASRIKQMKMPPAKSKKTPAEFEMSDQEMDHDLSDEDDGNESHDEDDASSPEFPERTDSSGGATSKDLAKFSDEELMDEMKARGLSDSSKSEDENSKMGDEGGSEEEEDESPADEAAESPAKQAMEKKMGLEKHPKSAKSAMPARGMKY